MSKIEQICRAASRRLLAASLIALLTLQVASQAAATIDFEEVSFLDRNETSQLQPQEAKQEAALKQAARLTVIAPKYLRPNSDYHVLINLANSRSPATVDLQLIGARDSDREQVEARSVLANSDETQTIKFAIGDWPAAEYVLQVNAQAIDRSWNFSDERQLAHQAKSYSGFIQTDKAIYKPGQEVRFRVLLLTPTLRPHSIKNGISVTVLDPRKNIIKHWSELSNYRGLLTLELQLTEDPMLGDYTIRVEAQKQAFEKQFTVAEYVLPTFDVTIQLPKYATYNQSEVVASVRATYTYGKPVRGHATLTVEPLVRFSQINTQPLNQAQYRARLEPDGRADFQLDLVRELRLRPDLFEREIEFFALVEEDLTGRKYNRTQTMRIHATSVKIERLHASETFKPGMVQQLQYKVAYQDDTPVEDNRPEVELKYAVLGKRIKSFRLQPRAGLIEHELAVPARVASPQSEEHQIVPNQLEIEAQYRGETHHLDPMDAYQSQSHQYLQIQLPQLRAFQRQRNRAAPEAPKQAQAELNINDQLQVRVQSTEPMQQVTCQGFARGDIVWALSRDVANKSELNFEVRLDERMAPEMRIICFHVRAENKELIADSANVQVGGLARNLLKVAPNRDEAKPGQEVEVSVFTKPNSLVGVLAIDQSVLLLKSGNDLEQSAITSDIKSYGSGGRSSSGESRAPGAGTTDQTMRRNTASLFDGANVVVLSNNLIYNGLGSRLGHSLYNPNALQYTPQAAAPTGNKIALDSLILDHELEPPAFHLTGSRQQEPIRIRREFPETWLWQNGTADGRGQAKFSGRVPDTITSWQLSAFSLSEAHGLAVSGDKRATIRVFRPFFIKLNLPYAIIRGETVSIQAIVFNYSKRPVVAKVTLENRSKQFEFVEAANTIEDERHSSSTSESKLVRIPAQEGASVSFLIQPTQLGYIDIRLLAQTETLGDGVIKKLLVKPEGQVQHLNKAMLIQLDESRPSWRRNLSIEVPANAVEGSQKVFVSAVGDILGSGLSNLDDLLRLPYGCGEQNMINLVPNLVILNYLQNTKRLRDSQLERARRNIETGYQRQLNYKRSDGSFSAFGERDANGSVWLTAYVLKTLQQARQVITVDERILQEAAQFIGRHSRPDGSIEEVGMLHNKALATPQGQEPGVGNSVYLTAYAMIALLQRPPNGGTGTSGRSGSAASSNNGRDLEEVLERGLDYLERQLDGGARLGNYELAIIAYALELAGRRQAAADRAYERLWERAQESGEGETWWPAEQQQQQSAGGRAPEPNDEGPAASRGTGEREFESLDAPAPAATSSRAAGAPARLSDAPSTVQPPLKPFGVHKEHSAHLFVPESLSVEQSAWSLLTATRRRELERALPIVRWLIGQQNSRGGFASTQDTVLAIEALASYAEAVAGSSVNASVPLSIDVEFIYPRASGASKSSAPPLRRTNLDQLIIRRQNALVQQQTRLPDNITWVQVQATGAGLAVVQLSWQYNLLVSAERPAFYLNPILDRRSTLNYLQLSICTFYKGTEGEPADAASNMAVLEAELPSGYVADVEALASLRRQRQIKRIDTEAGETRVIIYLERVTRDELCLTLPAHRSSKVSNNRPVPVTIYDYYDRKRAARIFYEPQLASSCDICADSDSCGQLCESKPKRSGRLISLHEQRLQQQQQRQNQDGDGQAIGGSADVATVRPTAAQGGTAGGGPRSRLADWRAPQLELSREAAAYLPLSSAFSVLVGALRRPEP